MPGKAPKRSYWDACVFLAWVNKEPDRVGVVDALLDSAGDGVIEIVTSVISITEVALAAPEQAAKVLSAAELARIDNLWKPRSPVKLAECHVLIATDARELMRKTTGDGWKLKAPDAIHLSTAVRLGCQEFLTYDSRLFKFDSIIGMPVKEPFADRLPLQFDEDSDQDSD
jgi:predicted nucleic acid-binding protein